MDEMQKNAFRVLRLPESATQEEIRAAYEKLEERYSETRYLGSPLWDVAAEKRARIQEAYDVLRGASVQTERMAAQTAFAEQAQEAEFAEESQVDPQAASAEQVQESSISRQIRMCLNANDLEKAQRLLDAQPGEEQEAELIYLRGMLAWKRGWLDEAIQQLDRALSLCPRNQEYQSARKTILYDAPPSTVPKQYRQKTKAGRFCAACFGECFCELFCEALCGGC